MSLYRRANSLLLAIGFNSTAVKSEPSNPAHDPIAAG